jgi:branched-chain amino acid transport system ATP-binding protein
VTTPQSQLGADLESPGPPAADAHDALAVRDLHAYIGSSHILQGVDLRAPRGQVTMILGRNGAGKTTTLRSILGLANRTGTIMLDGERIDAENTAAIIRKGVGYVPENRDVFAGLTVGENLKLAERRGSEPRYEFVFSLFPELKARLRQLAGTMSGGQQQMLAMGRALLNDSKLLIVDEPAKGLAPLIVRDLADTLDSIRRQATIVMVEQNLAVARRLADRVVVIANGRVALSGPAGELFADDETLHRYLVVDTRGGSDV